MHMDVHFLERRMHMYIQVIQVNDYVKAVSGHFLGKHGQVVRMHGDQACVVWDGVWNHGVWTDISDLKRTKRYKRKDRL